MKVTIIPIVIGAFGTVTKGLLKGLEDLEENKREQNCGLCCPGWPLKECEEKDEYLDLARYLKKTMEHEGDNYNNRDWRFWYSNQKIIKGTWR